MTGFVGEVRMFAGVFVPDGWVPCDGRLLSIAEYDWVFAVLGTTFGGDGQTTFAVPDLCGRTPLGTGAGPGLTPRTLGETGGTERVTLTQAQMPAHQHGVQASAAQATETAPTGRTWGVAPDATPYAAAAQATATMAPSALGAAGGNQPHENRSPVVAVNFGLCVDGVFPAGGDDGDTTMGEIRLWAGTVPSGWRACDGALLPINTNQALFSILGTAFGGNGVVSFGVPDLRGRVPVGVTQWNGAAAGAERVTLTSAHLPPHVHVPQASSAAATGTSPAGATWAVADRPQYAPTAQVAAAPTAAAGGGQPHDNMPPYTALTFAIATAGVYPSRN